MNATAAENREYAGPHDAADLLISSGTYVTVVNRELSDEHAAALGFVFDADEAMTTGKTFAVRRITISGELADALGDSDSWPKVGGTASDDSIVDDASHPARQTYETFEGEQVKAGELNERVRVAAAADESAERQAEEAERQRVEQQNEQLRIAAERRHGEVTARIAELDGALKSAQALADDSDAPAADRNEAGDDAQKISDELAELVAERKRLEGNA